MTARTQRRRGVPPAGSLAVTLLLAACAAPPPQTAPTPVAAPPVAVRAPSPEAALDAFSRRHREAARAAEQQSRWLDAVWGWDVVLALEPDDREALARRAAAASAADKAASDRLQQARSAQQRGDTDAAVQLYLETLAHRPDDPSAATALREIEAARAPRRNAAAVAARAAPRAVARNPAPTLRSTAPSSTVPAASPGPRNEFEHAGLLARQGEFDAAIKLLEPLAFAPGGDREARSALADVYYRQAAMLATSDPTSAKRALMRCLQLDPRHKDAALLWRKLRDTAR
ncbi:hypothetical protein [Roseateles sp.]|uniref:hypothetical protein n=1 Tax=Roseateles sp. TaxID=1971397 RepID=UPI0039EBFD7E